MRPDVSNQIRGLFKNFGTVPDQGQLRNLGSYTQGDDLLAQTLRALSAVLDSLNEQIQPLNDQLVALTRTDERCQVLMTIPGVGPLTAVAFIAAVDDPERFSQSQSVGAYLGLTPRRYQSGEIDLSGPISKCGDSLVRGYLYEAAGVLLTRVKTWSSLKAWGHKIARRAGPKKAKVAVARKLAVIMHRILCTREGFRWSATARQEVAT